MAGANVDELRHLQEQAQRPRVQHLLARHADEAAYAVHCLENPQLSVKELADDLAELQALLPHAKGAESALREEIRRTQRLIEDTKLEVQQQQETEAKTKELLRAARPAVDIKQYAWDQSDQYVKVYVSLDGLTGDSSQVDCQFHANRFEATCFGVKGSNYSLRLGPLYEPIDPKQCSVLVKPGRFVVKLKKSVKSEWAGLDNIAKLQKLRHEQLVHGGASTAELLANMYADADDETRRGLAEAAHQGRLKREEANKQTLASLGVAP